MSEKGRFFMRLYIGMGVCEIEESECCVSDLSVSLSGAPSSITMGNGP